MEAHTAVRGFKPIFLVISLCYSVYRTVSLSYNIDNNSVLLSIFYVSFPLIFFCLRGGTGHGALVLS